MDIFEAIDKRHSYRGNFLDKEIPREDLVKILNAGIQAPSGKNAQTTDFLVVTNREAIEKISGVVEKEFIATARAVIVCVVSPEPVYFGHSFEKEDCSAAVENMLLAVTALGYTTVWIDGALRLKNRAETLGQMFRIPPGKRAQILLPIGIPAEKWEQKEKKPFEERVVFEIYP